MIGNIGDETGSFWGTWLGSSLGLIIGFGLDVLIFSGDMIIVPICSFIGILAVGPFAFNKTRRYKSPSTSNTALFNIADSKVSLAFPSISFRPGSLDNRGFINTVSLMNISF